MVASTSKWLAWLKWDLRILLAILLGLAIVSSVALAVTEADLEYTFDFGTASISDLQPGAILVSGGASMFPKTASGLQYGWDSASVQATSRGAAVEDRVNRDYNFVAGSAANFQVQGLPIGGYLFRFIVGDTQEKIATRITTQGRVATITKTGEYGFVDLPVEVTSASQMITINFASAAADAGWGINGIKVYRDEAVAPSPNFNMAVDPAAQAVRAGGVATYGVDITPVEGYGSQVNLSISGLVAGITAEFIPAALNQLPARSELRLRTTGDVSPANYEFIIRAVGSDAGVTTKTAAILLVVRSADSQGPIGGGEVPDPSSQSPDGEERTQSEIEAEFDLIDEYVALEAERIVGRQNFTELKEIRNDFQTFPVLVGFPEPENAIESSLQFLTRTGIIEPTVSSAPRGREDQGPQNLFQRLFSNLASPLGE